MQLDATFRKAVELKYPEQVVLVLTRDGGGKVNVITLGWSMLCSHNPPMMAIAVGNNRYSHGSLVENGEFVLAFPGVEMAEAALFCGTHSGRDTDKIAHTGFQIEKGARIDVPILSEAVSNFECRVVSSLVTGDHTVFVGEVLASHHHPDPPRRLFTLGPNYDLGFPGVA